MSILKIILSFFFIFILSCKNEEQQNFYNKEIENLKIDLVNLKAKNEELRSQIIRLSEKNKMDYPNINFIKKSLIGKETKEWIYSGLSEFKNVKVLNELKNGTFYEATIELNLEDYKTKKYFVAKVFVQYINNRTNWELKQFDHIEFKQR